MVARRGPAGEAVGQGSLAFTQDVDGVSAGAAQGRDYPPLAVEGHQDERWSQ